MSRGNDGILIFRDDDDRRLFLDLLAEEVIRCRWIVHDYSLMGNHFHISIGTPECTLSTGMQRFLSRYAQGFNRRHSRRGHLFQDRFKNVLVEDETQGLTLSRYIALNPVRAGLCARPEDWQWSSYAARIGIVPVPEWLTLDPVLNDFGKTPEARRAAYRQFVEEGIPHSEDLEQLTVAQKFLGSPAWISKVQVLIDGEERSEEFPRDQVHVGRPNFADVVEAVAAVVDVPVAATGHARGSLDRQLVAYFAFEEALVPLREIARKLGMLSAGGVSSLVARCRRQLARDAHLQEIVVACRNRMKRRPPPFVTLREIGARTARHYHRAGAISRR
jgi:REP element-mobilizing transposase RayT